jgi:hypothetical protein
MLTIPAMRKAENKIIVTGTDITAHKTIARVIKLIPPLVLAFSTLDRKYSPVVAHKAVCRVVEKILAVR